MPIKYVKQIAHSRLHRAAVDVERAYTNSRVQAGDVLISVKGTIGRVGVVPPRFSGNIARELARLRIARSHSAEFVAHQLEAEHTQKRIAKEVVGSTRLEFSIATLRDFHLPIPGTLSEERKIADILTTWDEALAQLDALIEAQERRKKALMQQLLTGRRRLKGFSKPWKRFRFSELLEPQDRYVEFDDDHTYSLVSIRRRSGGVFFREALQGADIKTKVMKRVHSGDFLISRMQVVHGALGMVRPECDGMYASDSYDVLVTKDAKILHMPFLDWMSRMRSFWHLAYISSHGVHIEKMTFKLSDFMHEKITLPSDLEEQRQIAAILDTADQQLTLLRTQRTALDQQKRGLMQRLLTGKLRVKL
ncbi:MAG: restriction endonuclease subunit S [Verrucomicrobiaceae bacterium]|nr:restriction endonuclease subunit S [Verrucomicrobiaceae bacterium]